MKIYQNYSRISRFQLHLSSLFKNQITTNILDHKRWKNIPNVITSTTANVSEGIGATELLLKP